MRNIPTAIFSMVAALALTVPAYAEMTSETHDSTSTTTRSGTVSEVSPSSSTIIIKSESEKPPSKYIYNSKTVWVDSEGNTVTMAALRDQPVTIYYEKQGDQLVVTRVVAQKPASP
jgi:hypothetical protein